jgi:hypothetical protein
MAHEQHRTSQMEHGKQLPTNNLLRQKRKDDMLWHKEQQLVEKYGLICIKCPCVCCKGVRRGTKLSTMEDHLIHHGRNPQMWVWKGLGEKDSSNDEWEYVCRPHRTQFP